MRAYWSRLAGTAITVGTIFGVLWAMLLRDLSQRYTRGERPGQYSGQLDADLLNDYGLVFVIAHNAGDDAHTGQTAIDNSADAIEIDVILVGGTLYAAHATPPKLIGARFFRGPKLEDAWRVGSQAAAVTLDLKDDSPAYEDALVAFLDARPRDQVILNSRSLDSMIRLGQRLPNAHLYVSVPSREAFDRLADHEDLACQIDGYSMHQRYITEEVMTTVRARNQRIIAWTVNDLTRVNELVRLGVDGITTDNLAILRLLGGRERPEPLLRRRDVGHGPDERR